MVLTTLSAVILSGCSLSALSMSPDPPEPPRPDKKTVVEKKPGELDTGATQHKVTAQGKTLVLEYSTEQDPLKWTSGKRANVWLYANMPKASEIVTTKIVYVRIEDSEGTVVLEDSGSFVVTPPYTYGTVIATYPRDLYLTIDILTETEEDSGEFYKQRFVDKLTLTPAE